MSEDENVLARWSRLKREASKNEAAEREVPVAPQKADRPVAAGTAENTAEKTSVPPPAGKSSARTFDPDSLPPIDSISATSDIRSFLQAGVPEDLTRAALRRVWSADPEIREFIGLAENQWDFTDPLGVPGFGSLESTGDIRDLVAQATGEVRDAAESLLDTSGPAEPSGPPTAVVDQASGMPEGIPTGAENTRVAEEETGAVAAMQYDEAPSDNGSPPNRRTRGRALPQ